MSDLNFHRHGKNHRKMDQKDQDIPAQTRWLFK